MIELEIMNQEDREKEKKEIIEQTAQFVRNNVKKLELYYGNADGGKRNGYIKSISMKEYIEYLVKVSVVILTANEYEENILNYYAHNSQKNAAENPILEVDRKVTFKTKKISFNAYILKIDKYYVLHLHAQNTGSYTIGGSADMVRYVAENEYLHPTCIISFGICFGHDHTKQELGDTIIAKTLYPYFIGAKLSDGTLTVKSHDFILNLSDTSNELYETLEKLKKNKIIDVDQTDIECNVDMGNLITGEAVLSDGIYKKIFEDAAHAIDPKGGEMEGYGMGKECLFYNIPCLLIKSICDWGSEKNIDKEINEMTHISNTKDKIQAYTSYCAYTVLKKLFNERIFEESLYEKYKNKLHQKAKIGNGCFVPSSEIVNEFKNYNDLLDNTETYKMVTSNYRKKFCEIMIKDGVWEASSNSNGYTFKEKGV